MKKLIAAALAAAVIMPAAIPAAAQAQHRGDHRGSDYRGDRGRDDHRGNRADRSFNERDHNWRDNDWRDHRNGNRGIYSRGNWRAPFRYTRFRAGLRIGPSYYGPRYIINDPWRYHLPRAGWGRVWVRHYDDLLLVDTRRGVVIRVIDNFYW
jgi:Ni/Co efflux regulator RcnB